MADPVPLRDPSGLVRAYACGLCLRIGNCGDFMGGERLDGDQIGLLSESSESNARRCCTCRRCGKAATTAVKFEWVCEPCAPLHEAEEAERTARCLAAEDERVAAWKKSLDLSKDSGAACQLATRMSELSEDYYCAGWLVGCEFTLWSFVVDGPGSWGFGEFQQSEADELRALSEKAGGWVIWDSDIGGNVFVPTDEWARRYADV